MISGLLRFRKPVALEQLDVEGLSVQLVRKRVKYLNMTVHPPDGRIRVCAPVRASQSDIRTFVISRRTWIQRQQERARRISAAAPSKFESGETHFFRGRACRLEVLEASGRRGRVEFDADRGVIQLTVPFGAARADREKILQKWHRQELTRLIPAVLERWETVVGAEAHDWGIKRMKTKWGTCNTRTRHIWISLELIKKSADCLDYIMVHELTHLLERGHGARFKGLMDQFMPDWRQRRAALHAHGSEAAVDANHKESDSWR